MPYIGQLTSLKELNLEDNEIKTLPPDLSQIFPNLESLNLNGNDFEDDEFKNVVQALNTIPKLTSLYINLHKEEEVDMVMRILERLEFLNGLPVERDILEEDEESEEEDEEED
jgi:Leucine-rich repeat (LRR) protein